MMPRYAVVTGGTRGIGYAIAERLVSDGLDVLVTGTRSDGVGPEGTDYHAVDFIDDESVLSFAGMLRGKQVDVLVNNAGINKIGEFHKIDIADFDRIFQVNLRVPFLLCQAVVPAMKEAGWGRIVNITSIFGHVTKEFRASYSTSKFGLDGMTTALSAEVSQYGVLANCVGPGFIDTELTRKVLGEKGMNQICEGVPMKRLGQVEEIAALVSWLAGEENTYMTGQNIMIDGGFTRV